MKESRKRPFLILKKNHQRTSAMKNRKMTTKKRLEDSAPSAEDYTSQSDGDTEGNVISNNTSYILTLRLSSSNHQYIQKCL